MSTSKILLRMISAVTVAACAAGLSTVHAASDTLAVTGARVIVGNGQVIESGTVVVRDGLIESVAAGSSAPDGVTVVDGTGMTLMPGFIDAHRHIIRGEPDPWMKDQAVPVMQDMLDAGITTTLSCGDPLPHILQLREKLADGSIAGPRLLAAGRLPLAKPSGPRPNMDPARAPSSWAPRTTAEAIPDEQTRAAVQQLKEMGVDVIKTVMMVTPDGPELHTQTVMVEEGRRLGLPIVTHAVTVMDTLAAVEAGVSSLVHTPVDGELTPEAAQTIAGSGIPMMSTLGVFVPFFSRDNEALFRDGNGFPWERLYHAGEGAVQARLLWNAGITLGFGTDTAYGAAPDRTHADLMAHEIRSLSLTFSPQDIVTIMTLNSAKTLGLEDEVGSLEPGKRGDLVLLAGNPLEDSAALSAVQVVVKGGKIMADHR